MSVIAGLIGRGTGESTRITERMLGGFRQYCPDGSPRFSAESCAIGAEILAADTAGRLPSTTLYVAGQSCAVFDGRLDDLDELRAAVGGDNGVFGAEAIFSAYLRFGEDFVSRLRGDFAFAIWDSRRNTLIAARDAFSVRPFCYACLDGQLLIASDPEQLIASGLVSNVPEEGAIVDYLLWDARFTSQTFFRQIRMLSPGHVLIYSGGRVQTRPYRLPIRSFVARTREEYWSEFQQRFDAAVARRMRSDRPVVAELSGGMDSSSIVSTVDRVIQREPGICPSAMAAAGVYPGLSCNEEPFIDAVSRHVSVPVIKWDGTRGCSSDEIAESSIGSPGGRSIMFGGADGQMQIARDVGARVVLSGIGGDQLAEPSGGIRDAFTEGRWGDAYRMTVDRPGANVRTTVRVMGALAGSFLPAQIRRWAGPLRDERRRLHWLTPWVRSQARPRPTVRVPAEASSEIARRNWRSLLSGRHAMAMTNLQLRAIRQGVEYRFPFLDLDLVSMALSIPARFWPPPWRFERLHRETLRDRLPPEIVERRSKANFQPALEMRVRRHLRSIQEIVSSGPWRSEQFVERAGAQRLLAEFSGEKPDLSASYGLWTVATLEAWMRAVSRLHSGANAERLA